MQDELITDEQQLIAAKKRRTSKHVTMIPQRLTEHHFLTVMLGYQAHYEADGSFELHKEEVLVKPRSEEYEKLLGVVV